MYPRWYPYAPIVIVGGPFDWWSIWVCVHSSWSMIGCWCMVGLSIRLFMMVSVLEVVWMVYPALWNSLRAAFAVGVLGVVIDLPGYCNII